MYKTVKVHVNQITKVQILRTCLQITVHSHCVTQRFRLIQIKWVQKAMGIMCWQMSVSVQCEYLQTILYKPLADPRGALWTAPSSRSNFIQFSVKILSIGFCPKLRGSDLENPGKSATGSHFYWSRCWAV